ncbi:MAG: T9SS type A sorting domain-containing protein, partial [Bacteroidales bacterium]|nr:T9SS type A sorting domain-containing protein [Bacteroidales bacterium]
ESSYRLKLVDDGVTTVKGPRSHADEHEITINPEWNWIGYPLDTKRNVNTATDGFTPEANDIMKSHNESSIYYSGYGWYPVINLEPGKGYMYKSNADVAKTLTYNVSRNEELATPDAPHLWTTNRHAFADNLTVIAAVYVDGERLADGNMELGAFVNGECRGSAILKHFPPLDCYYAVLTVSGEDGDAINFGLIDRIGGVMNFNSQENMVFEKNAVAGDIENPYEVRFSTASNSQMTFSMYPNPVEKGRTITLDIPGTETVTEVVITDILGTVIRRNTDGSRVVKGLTTRGVYDIQVFTASGNIYHGRLIVK